MRSALLLGALELLLAPYLHAGDFWKNTKFTEWNDKEVRQMITNSPWAKKTEIPLSAPTAAAPARGRSRRGGGGGGGGFSPDVTGGAGMEGGGAGDFGGARSGASGPEINAPPTIPVVVRWSSALPVKQAVAKSRWGTEAATSADAAKFLQREEQLYVVSVSGIPARMLQADPTTLKAASLLKIGKLAPVPAVDVRIMRGQPTPEIFLIFPRSQPGGHVITLDDKTVEVITHLGPLTVERKFQLKDMVFEGKLEL